MRNVFQRLESVIRTDVAVLITGSSGTGKDLAACAIHYNGARRNHRFIAINCAAIPETLIESELFGHCRGAFTDAKTDKPGRFEVADGGTVFLDEIGELNPHIQVKLLRVIEMKEVTRLGEDIPRKVDVRIIAATNRDLRKAIESGEFREDFYYRLRVAQINMPDLKDRREDIPMLSNHFLRHSKSCEDNNFKGFSPRAMNTLVNYYWPGNVRELQNVIESAIVFGQPPLIQMNDLPLDIFHKEDADNLELSSGKSCSLEVMEKKHIESVLRIFNGNKTQCSKILGITRPTLDRKIKKYRIIIE